MRPLCRGRIHRDAVGAERRPRPTSGGTLIDSPLVPTAETGRSAIARDATRHSSKRRALVTWSSIERGGGPREPSGRSTAPSTYCTETRAAASRLAAMAPEHFCAPCQPPAMARDSTHRTTRRASDPSASATTSADGCVLRRNRRRQRAFRRGRARPRRERPEPDARRSEVSRVGRTPRAGVVEFEAEGGVPDQRSGAPCCEHERANRARPKITRVARASRARRTRRRRGAET